MKFREENSYSLAQKGYKYVHMSSLQFRLSVGTISFAKWDKMTTFKVVRVVHNSLCCSLPVDRENTQMYGIYTHRLRK